MTEEEYQSYRKVMKAAYSLRNRIIKCKKEVGWYTACEMAAEKNLQPNKVAWAREKLLRYMDQLAVLRKEFVDLKIS